MRTRYKIMSTILFFVLILAPNFSLTSEAKVREPLWGFFHPAWTSSSHVIETSDLAHLSTDPENRIEIELRIPKELRSRVLFWAAVFTRFNAKMKVIHDRNDPGLIYGFIDFSPLYSQYPKVIASILAEKAEERILAHLEESVLAVGNMSASALGEGDQEELRSFLHGYGVNSKAKLEALAVNIRTQTGQSDAFRAALERSEPLLPHIESVFAEYGLPRGLARLPFVESSFNANAKSKVGAMGLWQMMPPTARELMGRDKKKWSDPIHQTKAAAKLFRQYRRAMPDWASTITSYNSGIGRLKKLVKKHGSGINAIHADTTSRQLGFAGKNFFAELLAANLVENYKHLVFPTKQTSSKLGMAEPLKIPSFN